MALPDKQAKRIYAHYSLGMSKAKIARCEEVRCFSDKLLIFISLCGDVFSGMMMSQEKSCVSHHAAHCMKLRESGGKTKMIDKTYNVGIYCRLSNDDERDGESVSIENQKLLLQNYVRQRGWNEYDTYCDDGYSGTNFERPAVKRLIEDAKAKKSM